MGINHKDSVRNPYQLTFANSGQTVAGLEAYSDQCSWGRLILSLAPVSYGQRHRREREKST